LLEIYPDTLSNITPLPGWGLNQGWWFGQANTLDPHPMYDWPIIDEVATATQYPATTWAMPKSLPAYPPIAQGNGVAADVIIRQRRSAQHFDSKSTLAVSTFYHILDSLLPRPTPPWDVWPSSPRLHLLLFVHRVERLSPGLYILPRSSKAKIQLKSALSGKFSWTDVTDCPEHLPLFQLAASDYAPAARTLSCHQTIASHGFFSIGMLAEFEVTLKHSPWRYRELFWEAGLIGQVLYLEAEAAGVRGTGIGCYFDDAVHDVLNLSGHDYQSLYHFTIGYPLQDNRIMTLPPYSNWT
jgi:nitroreductase